MTRTTLPRRLSTAPSLRIRAVAGSEFLLDQALIRTAAKEFILFDSARANHPNLNRSFGCAS
jgi:hypothetical protein